MKNTLLEKNFALVALLMAAAFFGSFIPLTGNAQNSSTKESLEGTSWQGTIDFLRNTTITYVFTGDGQVTETLHTQFLGWESYREYNTRTRHWDLNIKPKTSSEDRQSVCKYKQDGESIQFHCQTRIWNTTIQGNRMEGDITINQGTPAQKTGKWSIQRIVSDNEDKNKSNKASLNGEPAGNEAEKFFRFATLPPLQPQQYREGIEEFTAEITRDPKNASSFQHRAWCKYSLQDYRGAIDDLTRAIALNVHREDEDKGTLHSDRGDANFKLQDYREAIADYDEVIQCVLKREGKICPPDELCIRGCEVLAKDVYYKRGIARNILGDKVNACEDFRKSCKLGNSAACEKVKDLSTKK